MAKKAIITEEERAEFRQAIRGTKKLASTNKVPKSSPQKPLPSITLRKPSLEPLENSEKIEFSDFETLPNVTGDEPLQFARSGIQHKMLRKLRLGQYNVEAILDLHGRTAMEARDELSQFLIRCQRSSLQHVLIIHGKGRDPMQPVLKNKLNHWLRQTNQVLAFCSATPKDGHRGALYVLLRR